MVRRARIAARASPRALAHTRSVCALLPTIRYEPPLEPPLLPEGLERPRFFPCKKVVFLSARVHPGETPASFVLDGVLEFLLREADPRAIALRERFVFKLIPMLNPDGVARGNYRADQFGLNLNRAYDMATMAKQPSIFAAMAVLRQLHERGQLWCYVDTHAHAGKRGCFLYGNRVLADQRHDGPLYAHLCAMNARFVDTDQCVFYDGESRHAGSGREAVYAATKLPLVFTLECNYCDGKRVNDLGTIKHASAEAHATAQRCLSPPPAPFKAASRYSPSIWREVGKGLALAALDWVGENPCSRVSPPASIAKTLEALRVPLGSWVKAHTVVTTVADNDSEADEPAEEAEEVPPSMEGWCWAD